MLEDGGNGTSASAQEPHTEGPAKPNIHRPQPSGSRPDPDGASSAGATAPPPVGPGTDASSPRHARIAPLGAWVEGSIRVPGSKSLTNRAIFLAMAAKGTSTLNRPLESDDTTYGLAAAKALGCRVTALGETVTVEGIGAERPVGEARIHVGSAGTVARFLPCFLAFGEAGQWHLESSQQMARRPMDGLLEALAAFDGAVTATQNAGRYPLFVRGQAGASPLKPARTDEGHGRAALNDAVHDEAARSQAHHHHEGHRSETTRHGARQSATFPNTGQPPGDPDRRPNGGPDRQPPEDQNLHTQAGPVEIVVDASISSQYLSGILIAAPLLGRHVAIRTSGSIVQSAYVEMTVDYMRRFGAEVEADVGAGSFLVAPRPYEPATIDIEADASTASYFAALPAVCGGSIRLPGLERHTRQPDSRFLTILEEFGCQVTWDARGASITRPAGLDRLRGGRSFDLNDCSDIALTVGALAVFADEPTRISGVEHIRKHESDRIEALAQAMEAFGIRAQTHRDGWTIWPGSPWAATVGTHDDHRVAMSMALVGLGGQGVRLDHPRCVEKTCPQFYELITSLGAQVDFE